MPLFIVKLRRVTFQCTFVLWFAAQTLLQSGGVQAASGAPTLTGALPPMPLEIMTDGLRRETRRVREAAAHDTPDALQAGGSRTVAVDIPEEDVCHVLARVEFDTGTVERARLRGLQHAAAPWLQRCVGVRGLEQLIHVLNAALLAEGLATSRAVLPPQNLSGGTLRIKVHWGRIGAVESEPGLVWQNAFPIAVGQVLDVHDLDQGIEQMNRLHSRTVAVHVQAGAEPDASVIRIRGQSAGNRLRGTLTLDNSGAPAIGRTQLRGGFALDNALGVNDVLSMQVNTHVEGIHRDRRSQSIGLSYSIPRGNDLFSLNAYATRFAQRVQLSDWSVVSAARSHGAELRWERAVSRNQSSVWRVHGGLSLRRARGFIDDAEIGVHRRRNTFAFLGLSHRRVFSRASLDVSLEARKGVGWLGAEADASRHSHGGVTFRPWVWTASANLSISRLVSPVSWSSSLRMQYAGRKMLGLDQFSLGGRSTVRGFDGVRALAGESGFVWRNEWGWPITGWPIAGWPIAGWPVTAYVALDAGKVWGRGSSVSGAHESSAWLAGAALGVRSWWRGVVVDLAVAAPIARPAGFETARLSPYVSVSSIF